MASGETPSIGQMLLDRNWISTDQLHTALRRQQELGGRLGTALLEMDAISEELLTKMLSEQHSLPAVNVEELRDIPSEVLALLPAKVAARHLAVPFRMGRGRVDLAMREEPDIPALDELSFVLGRRIVVHVACEARMYEALDRYYGLNCSLRFIHLLERLNRSRDRLHEARPVAAETAAGEPDETTNSPAPAPRPPAPPPAASTTGAAPPTPSQPVVRRPPTSVPLSEEEKKALQRRQSREAVKPLSLDGVQEALEKAHSADEIGTALVGYLGQEFLRLLIFRVGQGKVRGWMGRSPALDEYRFRNWTVGFDEPSVFLNLRQGAEFFLGRLPAMPAHERLLRCWHGSPETECAVFPVKVRNRLVCALYGDRDSLGLAGLDVRNVQRLTAKAAIAFEMLLMQRKLRSS